MTAPVRSLTDFDEATLRGLGELLVDCVEGGASVSFLRPITPAKAAVFWDGVARGVKAGERQLFVAEADGAIVGTVQVILAQPENQPHRGDVAKMLVRRAARKQGIGLALLRAAEEGARRAGKTLLVLDTASADAERLYERNGWIPVGVIPGYALLPDGAPCDTRVYYKSLHP